MASGPLLELHPLEVHRAAEADYVALGECRYQASGVQGVHAAWLGVDKCANSFRPSEDVQVVGYLRDTWRDHVVTLNGGAVSLIN